MALFENYEGRMPQLQPVLDKYGFKSFEDVKAYTNGKGVDAYSIVESTQPICFENVKWAYELGAAIAMKEGAKSAAEAAKWIGVGLQAFCIPGSVADQRQVGIQRFQNGFAGKNFAGHGSGMGHTGAADRLNQRLLNHTVLHIQAQFACALLGSTPADPVGIAGNILDFLGLDPFSFFRDRRGAMIGALRYTNHVFHFPCVLHVTQFLRFLLFSR